MKSTLMKRVENVEREAKEKTRNRQARGIVLIYKRGEQVAAAGQAGVTVFIPDNGRE
jgi:hypothetical protein